MLFRSGGSVGTTFPTTEGGTLQVNANGSYTYTAPDSVDNNAGPVTESFTYTATDADGSSQTGTLTVEVTDTGPSLVDDIADLDEGDADGDGTNNQTGGNLLANDDGGNDGDLTVTAIEGGNVGTEIGRAHV
mgnify:CR=1 FL=1